MDMFLTYLYVFLVGGVVCSIGQILVIKTNMTTARILVSFVVLGVILQATTLYQYIYDFAKAGISVPIVGFGAFLAKGAIEAVGKRGIIGVFHGRFRSDSWRNCGSRFLRICLWFNFQI